jgi:hypothetical protein
LLSQTAVKTAETVATTTNTLASSNNNNDNCIQMNNKVENNDNNNEESILLCSNDITMDMLKEHANELQASLILDDVDEDSFWDCSTRAATPAPAPSPPPSTTQTAKKTSPAILDSHNNVELQKTIDTSFHSLEEITIYEPTPVEYPIINNHKIVPSTTVGMTLDNIKFSTIDHYFNSFQKQQQQQQDQSPFLSIPTRTRHCSISSSCTSNSSCSNNDSYYNNSCTINGCESNTKNVYQLSYENNKINNSINNNDKDNKDHFTFQCLMDHFSQQQQHQHHDPLSMEPRPLSNVIDQFFY